MATRAGMTTRALQVSALLLLAAAAAALAAAPGDTDMLEGLGVPNVTRTALREKLKNPELSKFVDHLKMDDLKQFFFKMYFITMEVFIAPDKNVQERFYEGGCKYNQVPRPNGDGCMDKVKRSRNKD